MVRARLTTLACVSWLVGCNGDFTDGKLLFGNLEVSPLLSDVGAQPVGVEHTFTVRLAATRADVTITDINLLHIDGEYFYASEFSDGLDTGAEEDVTEEVDPSDLLVIAKDEAVDLQLVYLPLREGYHRSQLQVASDATDGELTVEVRGQGATPNARVFPWVLDFGAVGVGQVGTQVLRVENQSVLPLVISSVNFTDAQFSTDAVLPLQVEPESFLDLNILVNPLVDSAQNAALSVNVGQVQLQRVALRVNDCENGSPEAYDRDEDGFTTCGGDCDDSAESVRPGGTEILDGADNDCNGLIDDNTRGYDDDGDGYCDHPSTCIDPLVLPGDCADYDETVHPGAEEELGDGIDNNCDGQVDGGTADFDADGYTEGAGDCAPNDPTVYPLAPELPDGKDNDCDDTVDEGTVLFDDDGDGWCEGIPASAAPCSDGVSQTGDCNDDDVTTFEGAPELVDYRDNDCNGLVDDGTSNYDDDGDGYTESATPPDCDDSNPNVGPATLEIPGNGIDDDCDPSTPSTGTQ